MDQFFERHEGDVPPRDALQFYLMLLGANDLPTSASEMPPVVYLPHTLLGDIENSILRTHSDGLERAQMSFFDSKLKQLRYSKVFTGKPDDTGREHTYYNMFNSLFGQKPVLSWHTHPNGTWYFSTQDVASQKGFQRQGFISVVGSIKGIVAMMQTRETAKMPLNAYSLYERTIKNLRRQEFIKKDNEETARLIEDLGLGYYFWIPGWDIGARNIEKTIPLRSIRSYS